MPMSNPKILNPETFDFSAERIDKARSMKDPLFAKRTFIEKLRSMRFDERDLKLIENAVQLLGTTNFKDPKKKNYSAHPLRVAGYVMSYDPSVEAAKDE